MRFSSFLESSAPRSEIQEIINRIDKIIHGLEQMAQQQPNSSIKSDVEKLKQQRRELQLKGRP